MVKLARSWNKCQPYPDIMTLASPEYLLHGEGMLTTGLVMSPELAGELNLSYTLQIPSATCLYTAMALNWDDFNSGSYLSCVADALRQHRMTPAGDTLTRIVFVTMSDERDCQLLCQVWIPLEEHEGSDGRA